MQMRIMGVMRAHIIVNGLVQGVFFRANTRDMAKRLGLTGWVRNMRDGSVEVIAEGEREGIDQLIEWCRHGPPSSRIDSVSKEFSEATGEFTGFKIDY